MPPSHFSDRLSHRLAAVLGLALVGCTGGGDGKPPRPTGDTGSTSPPQAPTEEELRAICDGGPEVEGHFLGLGYRTVSPGADCPSADSVRPTQLVCIPDTWLFTCRDAGRDDNQVFMNDFYGGQFFHEATAPTTWSYEPGPVVDVCWYASVYRERDTSTTCGRPLLEHGTPVVADPVRRRDWAPSQATSGALDATDRRALAAYWLDCARLEHASVASFSRFALDLMRLGAPPDLLEHAHRAALDEIDHARRCFALASRFHGEPLGPGPLPLGDVPASTRLEVAEALVLEGCIGETLAAVDAAVRLRSSTDPGVREALEVIVRDESDHAALAWRALRWMLTEDPDGSLAAHLDQVFREAAPSQGEAPESVAPTAGQLAHGLIPSGERARELERTWKTVILPSWTALRGARFAEHAPTGASPGTPRARCPRPSRGSPRCR